jgi:hypothetical protein
VINLLNGRAWLVAALIVFACLGVRAESPGFAVTGQLTDGGGEAVYAFGQEVAIFAKPNSTADRQLKALETKEVCWRMTPGPCK